MSVLQNSLSQLYELITSESSSTLAWDDSSKGCWMNLTVGGCKIHLGIFTKALEDVNLPRTSGITKKAPIRIAIKGKGIKGKCGSCQEGYGADVPNNFFCLILHLQVFQTHHMSCRRWKQQLGKWRALCCRIRLGVNIPESWRFSCPWGLTRFTSGSWGHWQSKRLSPWASYLRSHSSPL